MSVKCCQQVRRVIGNSYSYSTRAFHVDYASLTEHLRHVLNEGCASGKREGAEITRWELLKVPRLNAIDPTTFPGHVIPEISRLSCDCVELGCPNNNIDAAFPLISGPNDNGYRLGRIFFFEVLFFVFN